MNMNKKQKAFWKEYCIRSAYHDRKADEFYEEVLDETETMILCKAYPNQNVRIELTWLRKKLIGNGSLYVIVAKPAKFRQEIKQLSIFEMI